MTRVIHIDELSHPSDKSPLFACQYLSIILLVTMLHPNIHNKDTYYSLSRHPLLLSTSPHLSLAINYHLKIKRFFLSYLTLLFSVQSTFCERSVVSCMEAILEHSCFYVVAFLPFFKR